MMHMIVVAWICKMAGYAHSHFNIVIKMSIHYLDGSIHKCLLLILKCNLVLFTSGYGKGLILLGWN